METLTAPPESIESRVARQVRLQEDFTQLIQECLAVPVFTNYQREKRDMAVSEYQKSIQRSQDFVKELQSL